MKNSDQDDPHWEKTRKLLREHLTVPALEHPDFINSRVLEAIRRDLPEKSRPPKSLFSLVRLAWAGAAMLVAAAAVSMLFLPQDAGLRSEGEFISQVVDARAAMPQLSVTSFRVPDDRGVVLWIEGSDYIPANQPVQ